MSVLPPPRRGIDQGITLIRPEPGPTTLKRVPWGGRRLAALRGRGEPPTTTAAGPNDELPIGESWEFSTLAGSESRTQGRALSEVLGGPLPFLAKLIDTAAPLSIQVHPEDDPVSGRLGKEEAWIVLDAEPGASVLAGAADGVRDDDLARAMEEAIARPERGAVLLEALRKIPVERGMVILVPAGTVHSIGAGILLAEIQQPTDCTHRLFDYGSDRPIHPEAARAAWRIDAQPRIWRPGEPSGSLQGRHLTLHVQTPGEATLSEAMLGEEALGGQRAVQGGSGRGSAGASGTEAGRYGGGETEGPRLLVAVGEGVRLYGPGPEGSSPASPVESNADCADAPRPDVRSGRTPGYDSTGARNHESLSSEDGIAMAHGDLLLHTGGSLRVGVDEDALLVSGAIRP
jgi:hypothetical protein